MYTYPDHKKKRTTVADSTQILQFQPIPDRVLKSRPDQDGRRRVQAKLLPKGVRQYRFSCCPRSAERDAIGGEHGRAWNNVVYAENKICMLCKASVARVTGIMGE